MEQGIRCPNCGSQNLADQQFCGACGVKLAVAGTQQAAVVCPHCGAQNLVGQKFCGSCGAKMAAEPAAHSPVHPPAAKPGGKEAEATVPPPPVAKPIPEKKVILRVSSGIDGLDVLLGGGLISNKVYLVSGEAGTGKTVAALQFIIRGLMQNENAIFLSGEGKPAHIMATAESLGWELSNYIEEQRLVVLDMSTYFADMRVGKAKDIDVRNVVGDLTKQVRRIRARRVALDPIVPLVLGEERSAFVLEFARNLILAMEDDLQCTALATCDMPLGVSPLSRYGEGTILLGMEKRDAQRVRTLSIRKLRSGPVDLKDHTFAIQHGKGIMLLD